MKAMDKPNHQANRFCVALTHSGRCHRTSSVPSAIAGATRWLRVSLIIISMRKRAPKARSSWKSPVKNAAIHPMKPREKEQTRRGSNRALIKHRDGDTGNGLPETRFFRCCGGLRHPHHYTRGGISPVPVKTED